MGNLSKHFDRSEFACKDDCGFDEVEMRLISRLENLRAELGRPIKIVSGCRCCPHNSAVGGASRSQHTRGTAADIPRDLHVSVALAKRCGFKGIGIRDGYVVHVDVRQEHEAQVWTY